MIEPGWYDDPSDPRMLRWWDGSAWTEHAQPAPDTQTPSPAADITEIFAAAPESSPVYEPAQPQFSVPLDARWAPMPADDLQPADSADPLARRDSFSGFDAFTPVTDAPEERRWAPRTSVDDSSATSAGRASLQSASPRRRKTIVIGAVLAIAAIAGGQAFSTSRSGDAQTSPVAAPSTPTGTDVPAPGNSPTTAPEGVTGDTPVQPTAEPSTPTATTPATARPTTAPTTSPSRALQPQSGPAPLEPNAVGSAWGPTKGLYISWVAPLEGPRPERYEVTVRWNDSKTTIKTKNTETSLAGLRITKDCTVEVVSIIGTKRSTIASARCGS